MRTYTPADRQRIQLDSARAAADQTKKKKKKGRRKEGDRKRKEGGRRAPVHEQGVSGSSRRLSLSPRIELTPTTSLELAISDCPHTVVALHELHGAFVGPDCRPSPPQRTLLLCRMHANGFCFPPSIPSNQSEF